MPDADVVIFYNLNSFVLNRFGHGTNGMAYTGQGEYGTIPKYPMARNFVALNTTGMKRSTIAHEFGHFAGLEHEHEHPDVNKSVDKNCVEAVKNRPYKDEFVYSDFDIKSAMNYCEIHRPGGFDKGLSARDDKTLKSMYPN